MEPLTICAAAVVSEVRILMSLVNVAATVLALLYTNHTPRSGRLRRRDSGAAKTAELHC